MAYTTAGGTTESTGAPLTMPRLHVGRDETPSGLIGLLGGAEDSANAVSSSLSTPEESPSWQPLTPPGRAAALRV